MKANMGQKLQLQFKIDDIEVNVDIPDELSNVVNRNVNLDRLREKLKQLCELIEEIAQILDEELFNISETNVYPDNYQIQYSVRYDGYKILNIKHSTWLSDE